MCTRLLSSLIARLSSPFPSRIVVAVALMVDGDDLARGARS
jgi:hypothetical protein